jgi:hypothetical protein
MPQTHFIQITTCRFLSFLCGDHVVFAGPRRRVVEMVPSESNGAEFTMKLRSLATWDRLRKDDLTYNNVRRAGSSQYLEESGASTA